MREVEVKAEAPQETLGSCSNCGTELVGEYCHTCGEEQQDIEQFTVKNILGEIWEELVDVDSNLFRTIRGLLFQPGFLTAEFFAGRRGRYVRPLKLFLMVAAIQLLAATHEAGGGFLRFDFLKSADPGIEFQLEDKAEALGVKADELSAKVDELAQQIYSVLQFVAVALTGFLASLLFWGKNWSYVKHLLFSMHLYCFRYAVAVPVVPLLGWFQPLVFVLYVVNAVYIYLAVRRVYEPAVAGAVLKTAVLYSGVFMLGGILAITSLFGAYIWTMR